MKFVCAQKEFSKAVATAARGVSSKAIMPGLKSILLVVKGTTLTLVGTDMNIGVKVELEISGNEDGSALVNAKMLSDIASKLPNSLVSASCDDKVFTLSSLSAEFNLPVVNDDIPAFPAFGKGAEFKIDVYSFLALATTTMYAASIDAKKGVLQGCLLDAGGDGATMVALDGFRMAIAKADVSVDGQHRVIIPHDDIATIVAVLKDADDAEVSVSLSDKFAKFSADRVTVISRLLEGQYVNYGSIIPNNYATTFTVDKDSFRSALERTIILTEGKNSLIKLNIEGGTVTVTTRGAGGSGAETLDADVAGGDIIIGFNAKYILDALKTIPDDEICMKLTSPVTAATINPVEGDAFTHLVLPVRLEREM